MGKVHINRKKIRFTLLINFVSLSPWNFFNVEYYNLRFLSDKESVTPFVLIYDHPVRHGSRLRIYE